jgi:hypothetical protein
MNQSVILFTLTVNMKRWNNKVLRRGIMKSIITEMLSDLYLSRSVYFHLLKNIGKRDKYFEIYNSAQIEILEEIIDELKDKE